MLRAPVTTMAVYLALAIIPQLPLQLCWPPSCYSFNPPGMHLPHSGYECFFSAWKVLLLLTCIFALCQDLFLKVTLSPWSFLATLSKIEIHFLSTSYLLPFLLFFTAVSQIYYILYLLIYWTTLSTRMSDTQVQAFLFSFWSSPFTFSFSSLLIF